MRSSFSQAFADKLNIPQNSRNGKSDRRPRAENGHGFDGGPRRCYDFFKAKNGEVFSMEHALVRRLQTERGGADCFSFGAGERELVILPGLSLQSLLPLADAVAEAYAVFAPHYRVTLIDRRSDPPEGCTVRELTLDAAAAMDALGLRDADVFGVSQGGMLALCLAAERGELVRRLVLASTSWRVGPQAAAVLRRWIRLARAENAGALYADFAEALFSERFLRENAAALGQAPALSAQERERFSRLAAALEGVDLSDALGRIRCPALVIGAEADGLFPAAEMRALAQRLGAECFLYGEGYRHGVYDEAPDFKEKILAFLLRD